MLVAVRVHRRQRHDADVQVQTESRRAAGHALGRMAVAVRFCCWWGGAPVWFAEGLPKGSCFVAGRQWAFRNILAAIQAHTRRHVHADHSPVGNGLEFLGKRLSCGPSSPPFGLF